jgi:hypothetical protein
VCLVFYSVVGLVVAWYFGPDMSSFPSSNTAWRGYEGLGGGNVAKVKLTRWRLPFGGWEGEDHSLKGLWGTEVALGTWGFLLCWCI